MTLRRRTLLGGLAALPALGGLAACGSSGSGDTTEINYGYIPDFNGTSLLAIADDQGDGGHHVDQGGHPGEAVGQWCRVELGEELHQGATESGHGQDRVEGGDDPARAGADAGA